MTFDVDFLEEIVADEPEGLWPCEKTCTATCGITCTATQA
ncbi:ALQxL family class IV lanthipeptide [Streptomyces sp. CB02009]|nr:ALQxL family class IV lanthipeptide [Streptomyces sp. CB02009]